MSKRDLVGEVTEVKTREGRRSWWLSGSGEIKELTRVWSHEKEQPRGVMDYFPVRLVTLIEVFTRRWLERLVDHGPPYLRNAAALERSGLKLDFALSAAIQGRRVTLGQLVAHNVSLNSLEQLAACFTQILGDDFLSAIGQAFDRFEVERMGAERTPIISDLGSMCRDLSRLFAVRHILVHEMPDVPVYSGADVDAFMNAASEFVHASEQTLHNRLTPNYPLTTLDMVSEAGAALHAANLKLEDVIAKAAPRVHDPLNRNLLHRSQEAWTTYSELQQQLRACHVEGGSLQPVIRLREAERLATARAEELRWWLDREEGEL